MNKLPKVLVIQLKRFKIIRETTVKISSCVNFPFEINLNYLVTSSSQTQGAYVNSNKSTFFTLNGFIVHYGQGLNQGHYISIVKCQSSGVWYKIDDDNIKVSILFINY